LQVLVDLVVLIGKLDVVLAGRDVSTLHASPSELAGRSIDRILGVGFLPLIPLPLIPPIIIIDGDDVM
jgi:hypothetical protein